MCPLQLFSTGLFDTCLKTDVSTAVVLNMIICVHQLHTCLKTNMSTAVVFNKIISYLFKHKCVHCSCLQQDYLIHVYTQMCPLQLCSTGLSVFINSIPVYTQMCPLQLSSTGLSRTCLNTNVSTAVVFNRTSSIN